jgi:hypothetical protein
VKPICVPVKKTGKTEKSARETIFPPVKKIEKMGKNDFHGHFWFSRGKKKTLSNGVNFLITIKDSAELIRFLRRDGLE